MMWGNQFGISGYDNGWSWLLMTIVMVLFWGGVIALLIWAFRTFGGQKPGPDLAMSALRQRLASGEIGEEEFEKTRHLLQG